jgi:hypothetical protein
MRDSRLTWVTGTAYPAAPVALYIGLFRGLVASDGSDVASLEASVTRAGPLTFTSPASGAGAEGAPVYRTIQPTAPVSFTPPGSPGGGVHITVSAWGLFSVASGGTPIYTGELSNCDLMVGVAVSFPASLFQVSAESI